MFCCHISMSIWWQQVVVRTRFFQFAFGKVGIIFAKIPWFGCCRGGWLFRGRVSNWRRFGEVGVRIGQFELGQCSPKFATYGNSSVIVQSSVIVFNSFSQASSIRSVKRYCFLTIVFLTHFAFCRVAIGIWFPRLVNFRQRVIYLVYWSCMQVDPFSFTMRIDTRSILRLHPTLCIQSPLPAEGISFVLFWREVFDKFVPSYIPSFHHSRKTIIRRGGIPWYTWCFKFFNRPACSKCPVGPRRMLATLLRQAARS